MRKKLKIILIMAALATLCLGLAACKKSRTELDKLVDKGYRVFVSYNANGGTYLNRDGVTVEDAFHPDNFEKDSDGKIHIRLLEPTDRSRPTSTSDHITLTNEKHFLAGWYRTRTLVRDESGNPLDEDGVVIKEKEDGIFVYPMAEGEKEERTATPAYTYDGYWDFSKDTVDYSEEDDVVRLTLYAGWIPYYQFDYYYRGENGWVKYGSTDFDYKTTNAENSATFDKDVIWTPDWANGAMGHEHNYANGSKYTFPKLDGKTFSAAYTDEACTQKIETSFEHKGTLDLAHGTAVGRVQNIYVDFLDGERYRIATAEQLSKNGNAKGIYEILADLDFAGEDGQITWPSAFSLNTFTGKMYSSEGNRFKIKNVQITHSSDSARIGGLFGSVSKNAELGNLDFENITFDLVKTGRSVSNSSFGLFAGEIEEGAKISDVSVIGGMFRIGDISVTSGMRLHALANGSTAGITQTGSVCVRVYGFDLMNGQYLYQIDWTKVTMSAEGAIDVSTASEPNKRDTEPYHDIQ